MKLWKMIITIYYKYLKCKDAVKTKSKQIKSVNNRSLITKINSVKTMLKSRYYKIKRLQLTPKIRFIQKMASQVPSQSSGSKSRRKPLFGT